VIKRGDDQPATSSTGTSPESLSFAPVNPSFFCDGVSIPCVYEDPNVDSDVTYSYVVAAANNSGTSADSNPPASSKKLPKPGCEWKKQKKDAPNAGAFTSISHLGWSMLYSFSAKDELVVEQVGLNGRKMAERFSVRQKCATCWSKPGRTIVLTKYRAKDRSWLRARLELRDVHIEPCAIWPLSIYCSPQGCGLAKSRLST
jgi:hypothetical protein